MLLRALLLIACATVATACDSADLPNGYSVFWANGQEIYIVDPSGLIILGPTISRYAIEDGIVVGEIKDPESNAAARYFIVDTQTGDFDSFQQHRDWLGALSSIHHLKPDDFHTWKIVYEP